MRHFASVRLLLAVLLALLLPRPEAACASELPDGPATQVVEDELGAGEAAVWVITGMRAGRVLTLHVEGLSGNFDPFVGVLAPGVPAEGVGIACDLAWQDELAKGRDPLQACREVNDRFFAAWDDDSGKGYAARLRWEAPVDGDVRVVVHGAAGRPTFGRYRLSIDLDAEQPHIADRAESALLARREELPPPMVHAVQVIDDALDATQGLRVYPLADMRAGDELIARIEATDSGWRPAARLLDYGDKPVALAQAPEGGGPAILRHRFDEDAREFRLTVAPVKESPHAPRGYRLTLGRNAPHAERPEAASAGPAIALAPSAVRVGFKLQQISSVDQRAENFGVVATMIMVWKEPALAFSPDDCQCRFQSYTPEGFASLMSGKNLMWPEFSVYNQQGNRWPLSRNFIVMPSGSVAYLERFSTTLQAPDFRFHKFPFDRQDFYIRIVGTYPAWFYTYTDLGDYSEVGSQLGEEEWVVTAFDTFTDTVSIVPERPNARFNFHFTAVRHLNYYFMRIFLPLAVIVLVSWVIFFLKDYSKRIDAAGANLLLFIAFNFTISGELPRLGYLTFLDTILLSTFLVTAFVLIVAVMMKYLINVGRTRLVNSMDGYILVVYPLAYIVAVTACVIVFDI